MKIFSLLVLIFVSPTVFALPEIKGNPEELKSFLHPRQNVVIITGFAQEEAFSDKATINLVIKTEDKLMSKAIEQNASLRESVRDKLVRAGIKDQNINSSKFSQSPQYGWFGKKPDSYEVVNRLAIVIGREEHLKIIAEIGDSNEAITVGEFNFKHSEKEAYTEKVKQKALNKIEKQKIQYEESLGIKLKPIGIRNLSIHDGATNGAKEIEEVVVFGVKDSGSLKSRSYAPPPVKKSTFEEVKYSADISIEYLVESN